MRLLEEVYRMAIWLFNAPMGWHEAADALEKAGIEVLGLWRSGSGCVGASAEEPKIEGFSAIESTDRRARALGLVRLERSAAMGELPDLPVEAMRIASDRTTETLLVAGSPQSVEEFARLIGADDHSTIFFVNAAP